MTTHPLEVPLARVASRAGDGLDALRCRDDILQAMFWMRGEGFGEATDARGLSRLISADEDFVAAQLEVLAGDGHLEPDGDRYRLSPSGQHEGGRRFADEFAGLQLTAHGECPPDCPHCEGIARDGCTHCATTRAPDGLGSW
ncbi:MAG: hypothetical protein M3432_05550 [Chloroflexota bacterium]|nr:hypothetical protein [Chloroflexota bacterium]